MSRADGGLRAQIHKHMKEFGDWQAIETGLISGGVPDTNFCLHGVEGWIECKRTNGWTISNMQGNQVGWAERRARNGGRVFVAVRRMAEQGPRTAQADEFWLLDHRAMRPLLLKARLDNLQPSLVLGRWFGGPNGWDWQAIARLLVSVR